MENTINKVDNRTSDMFFNYGAVNYNAVRRNKKMNEQDHLHWLYIDADKFLYLIPTPNVTRQDLVNDFLNRL